MIAGTVVPGGGELATHAMPAAISATWVATIASADTPQRATPARSA